MFPCLASTLKLTRGELKSLAELAFAKEANPPTNALIRAMRDYMAVVIRRLQEKDEVENFDCGEYPLNNYLKHHPGANQEKSSIGVSYAAARVFQYPPSRSS